MQEERINELIPLQKTLDYNFNDLKLLNKALTHKSYSNETSVPVKNKHNSREVKIRHDSKAMKIRYDSKAMKIRHDFTNFLLCFTCKCYDT